MANPFQQIITQDAEINRIQGNISASLNQSASLTVSTVNSANFTITQLPGLLVVPTTSIASTVNIYLPDALKLAGQSFNFKKTDTSSNAIVFSATAKNKQGKTQTVENATTYSVTASLAYGRLMSDGNNWWVV